MLAASGSRQLSSDCSHPRFYTSGNRTVLAPKCGTRGARLPHWVPLPCGQDLSSSAMAQIAALSRREMKHGGAPDARAALAPDAGLDAGDAGLNSTSLKKAVHLVESAVAKLPWPLPQRRSSSLQPTEPAMAQSSGIWEIPVQSAFRQISEAATRHNTMNKQ